MDLLEVLLVVAFGVTGGLAAGVLGIGGGTLFIPAMVFVLDLSLLKAEGTALLAIAVVCLVGAWRQDGYGNVRLFTRWRSGCSRRSEWWSAPAWRTACPSERWSWGWRRSLSTSGSGSCGRAAAARRRPLIHTPRPPSGAPPARGHVVRRCPPGPCRDRRSPHPPITASGRAHNAVK